MGINNLFWGKMSKYFISRSVFIPVSFIILERCTSIMLYATLIRPINWTPIGFLK